MFHHISSYYDGKIYEYQDEKHLFHAKESEKWNKKKKNFKEK